MLAHKIAFKASHEAPLRYVVKEFIVPRMDANNLVRQVTVTPGRGVILRLERWAIRACDALLQIQDMLYRAVSGQAAAARWPPLVTRVAMSSGRRRIPRCRR